MPILDVHDLAAIADAVETRLSTVPRELKDVLMPGVWQYNGYVKSPANYCNIRMEVTEEGFWLTLEVNHYRLFHRFYPYSDEYRFPKDIHSR